MNFIENVKDFIKYTDWKRESIEALKLLYLIIILYLGSWLVGRGLASGVISAINSSPHILVISNHLDSLKED